MAENGRLPRNDAALLIEVARGRTLRAAAKTAGVSERTATRRMADPGFRQRIGEARAEMVDEALGQLAKGMAAAVRRLRKLVASADERVALGACRAVVELHARVKETADFEARIAALEDQSSQGQSDGRYRH